MMTIDEALQPLPSQSPIGLPFLAVSATSGRILRIGCGVPELGTSDGDAGTSAAGTSGGASSHARASSSTGDVLTEWQIMQTRLDREDEAEEMYKLWLDDGAAWLERAKDSWRARHRSCMYARAKALGLSQDGQPAASARESGGAAKPKATRKNRAAGEPLLELGDRKPGKVSANLLDLLECGLLQPGTANVFVVYQDNTWIGDLSADGHIAFQGQTFTSPSAWAIFAKRITNPTKKADDGWKSVRYGAPDGPSLDMMKGEFGRIEQLKAAGIEVDTRDAASRIVAECVAGAQGGSPSPRPTRKRKAGDAVTASADEMSWIERYPGCEHGAPKSYAGTSANENMDFTTLIGRDVCLFDKDVWWAARVVKLKDFDTHIEADLLYANGKFRRGVDLEELAGNAHLVILS